MKPQSDWRLADWLAWRRQPETYLNPGLGGIFTLFLHRLKPEPELVRAALARLRAIPRALEDGRRNIRPELAPPVFVDRAIRQARAGATASSQRRPALPAPLPRARPDVGRGE